MADDITVTVKANCGSETYCFETLAAAVASEWTIIELSEWPYELNKVSFTKDVTIKAADNTTVTINWPTSCNDTNSNHISDANAKAGTLSEGVTVTFEGITLNLWNGNCAWQWFAWDHSTSKVIIKDSTVKWRLTTFTNMELNEVIFKDTPSYNVDVHRWASVEFTDCIFNWTDRNINVYDWNNDGDAEHNVTFAGCTFTTSSATANKWAINIHESHANQSYAVKYNVTVTNANIEWWTYPADKEVIWQETWEGYYSKIVKGAGLISIDDIRRVITTVWWEISVTIDNKNVYSTPATTAVSVTANTDDELNAIKTRYEDNWYELTEISWEGKDKWNVSKIYTITLGSVSNGTIASDVTKAKEWATVTLTATPASNYNFWTWTVKDTEDNTIAVTDNNFTMPASDVTVSATFTVKSSGSSWGGGSRTTTKTDDAKATTWDTAKTDEQKTDDSKSDETKADETKTSEEAKAAADAQALKDGYSQEFIDAYNFARKNNITTKDTIREADMDAPLTRIAMAKMLSQYAINVLGKTPDTSIVVPNFPDVDAKLDADYNNWVTLAYQLGIMWIGIEKFRPFDLVTRAEFGTALSRMLYGLEDGEWNEWYSTHLAKLMEEKIITNNNPNLKELRGYVMIMLMRSAQ